MTCDGECTHLDSFAGPTPTGKVPLLPISRLLTHIQLMTLFQQIDIRPRHRFPEGGFSLAPRFGAAHMNQMHLLTLRSCGSSIRHFRILYRAA